MICPDYIQHMSWVDIHESNPTFSYESKLAVPTATFNNLFPSLACLVFCQCEIPWRLWQNLWNVSHQTSAPAFLCSFIWQEIWELLLLCSNYWEIKRLLIAPTQNNWQWLGKHNAPQSYFFNIVLRETAILGSNVSFYPLLLPIKVIVFFFHRKTRQ